MKKKLNLTRLSQKDLNEVKAGLSAGCGKGGSGESVSSCPCGECPLWCGLCTFKCAEIGVTV